MKLSWPKTVAETKKLAELVNTKIDVIVAVVRGGLVPARLLAGNLGVKTMYCLTVEKSGDKRILTTEITADLAGQHVLLVEDALETGTSLIEARKYLETKKKARVSTAALYHWPAAKVTPDYTLGAVESIPTFPWE